MVEAHKETNVSEGGSYKKSGVLEVNDSANDKRSGSSRLGGGLLTYKRRRNVRFVEEGMVWDNPETQFVEKPIKKSSDQASHERSHALTFTSRYCLLKHQRDIVLEQMCQSLETEAKGSVGIACSGSVVYGLNHDALSELCRCTFFDIIMSEKFAQLCSLLVENGMKADKLFDLSCINSRMKEKAYESSPMLFHSDIQQIWTKLQKLGNDITGLAKCLSDKTMTSFREQPPCAATTTIPGGKWFCSKCGAGIHRVRKAKSWYENMQNKYKKRTLDGKLKTQKGALNKSDGRWIKS